jgi:hypothetical protein
MGQAKDKVAADVAAVEFDRMCDANRVSLDTSTLTKRELSSWNETRAQIIADICQGRLAIDGEGRPVYTPEGGKSVTFNQATGATMMALETYGKGKNIANTVAAMADMTGANKGDFSRMNARDFKACSRIAGLFLASQ